MQTNIILKLHDQAKRTSARANQIEQAVISKEYPDNAFILDMAEHVGELKALAQELEDEVLKESAERRIMATDIAPRLKVSTATISRRWRMLGKPNRTKK